MIYDDGLKFPLTLVCMQRVKKSLKMCIYGGPQGHEIEKGVWDGGWIFIVWRSNRRWLFWRNEEPIFNGYDDNFSLIREYPPDYLAGDHLWRDVSTGKLYSLDEIEGLLIRHGYQVAGIEP